MNTQLTAEELDNICRENFKDIVKSKALHLNKETILII